MMSGSYTNFYFDNLASLRDWLNQFDEINLEQVQAMNDDVIRLTWEQETLSDGSTVHNVGLSA